MPYVEGYGTWPFGEEWLWEAMATSYLPLLDVLDAAPGRITLSLTPVLCDQLEAPGVGERFLAFLRDVRAETHRARRRGGGGSGARARARALRRPLRRGRRALRGARRRPAWARSRRTRRGRRRRPTRCCRCWPRPRACACSSRRGSRRTARRFGPWHGGLWLPECGYAPWLDEELEEAGVHAACVDLTDVLGYGAPAQLRPLRTGAGPLLVPIDRAIMDLVWHTRGYPSHGAYRNTRRYTEHRHTPWAVDGAPYDPARAARAGARRRRALRLPGRPPDRARRPLRVRARHGAARPLLARGGRLAGRGRSRRATPPASRSPGSTRRSPRGSRRCRRRPACRRRAGASRAT